MKAKREIEREFHKVTKGAKEFDEVKEIRREISDAQAKEIVTHVHITTKHNNEEKEADHYTPIVRRSTLLDRRCDD